MNTWAVFINYISIKLINPNSRNPIVVALTTVAAVHLGTCGEFCDWTSQAVLRKFKTAVLKDFDMLRGPPI
eukprot:scaffold6708_cov134-Cylindrotheca_fusiformis.AAC.30